MKKILLFTFVQLCLQFLNAQTPEVAWQKLMGGSLFEAAYDVKQTSDGGYIIAGSSDSQDGDVGSTNGDYDYWVIKLNSDGDAEWSKKYGGSDWDTPAAIQQTSDGGYIVVGYTYSDDGDVIGMNGFRDGWVVKINSTGVLQWQKALGGSGADLAADVLENTEGFLVLGFAGANNDGDLLGSSCNSDFWVVQLNYNGTIVWQECYGGSDIDVPEKIIPAGENYLIVGKAESNDGDITVNHGHDDMWVVQIDATGNLLGQKTLGGSETDIASDVYFSSSTTPEQIVVLGTTYSSDGDVSSKHGGLDFWMVTLDGNLDIITEKTFGGSMDDEAYSVLADDDGTFIITGVTQSNDGDVTGFNGGADSWVIKIDHAGNMIWNKCVGGSKGDVSYANVGSTNDNGFVLVGWTSSDEFDGYQGNDDLWIVKLGGMSSAVKSVAISEIPLKIYPNPGAAKSTIYIEPNFIDAERLMIKNISGQPVFEKEITGENKIISLSIPNLVPGTYTLEVKSPLNIQIGKLIVF